jgi:hypothetical protein
MHLSVLSMQVPGTRLDSDKLLLRKSVSNLFRGRGAHGANRTQLSHAPPGSHVTHT